MKENTSGWDAIEKRCHEVYPDQLKPKHYGTIISWALGGNDPLEGISIYDGGDYWHFVTYGLSELYEKVSKNKELSGYGMEFTLNLKKDNYPSLTVGSHKDRKYIGFLHFFICKIYQIMIL